MLVPSPGERNRAPGRARTAVLALLLAACSGTPPVADAPSEAEVRALLRAGPADNVAVTDTASADDALRARRLPAPKAVVLGTLLELIPLQPRWRVAGHNADVVWATRRTRVFRFVDDVYILCTEAPDGTTLVEVRSASRVGRSDLGQNRRNIAELWRALDRFLEAHHPPRPAPPRPVA